jgi:hypothetical protein
MVELLARQLRVQNLTAANPTRSPQRRRHYDAVVTELLDQPVQFISGRPGFIAEGEMSVPAGKLLHQLNRGNLGALDLSEKPNLSHPPAFRLATACRNFAVSKAT